MAVYEFWLSRPREFEADGGEEEVIGRLSCVVAGQALLWAGWEFGLVSFLGAPPSLPSFLLFPKFAKLLLLPRRLGAATWQI